MPEMVFDEDVLEFKLLHAAIVGTPGSMTFDDALKKTSRSDINTFDASLRTPLSWAIYLGKNEVATTLLQWGAEPNKCIDMWTSPAGSLPWTNAESSLQVLLGSGLDVAARDEHGRTLMHAALYNHVGYSLDVLQQILDAGADINARDKFGYTPLLLLLDQNRFASLGAVRLDWLLRHGADPTVTSHRGRSAISCVLEGRKNHLLSILLDHPSGLASYIHPFQNTSTLHRAAMFANEQGLEELRIVAAEMDSTIISYSKVSAIESAQYRRDNNTAWALERDLPLDANPARWYNTFCSLWDEVVEANELGAASLLIDGHLLQDNEERTTDYMPGSFPSD